MCLFSYLLIDFLRFTKFLLIFHATKNNKIKHIVTTINNNNYYYYPKQLQHQMSIFLKKKKNNLNRIDPETTTDKSPASPTRRKLPKTPV